MNKSIEPYLMKGDIRGVIFDIEGVLEFQGKIYPGAVDTIESLRDRGITLRFLTNSTLKSRESCAEKLKKAGFRTSYGEVITASYATAVYLRELKPRSIWVMLEGEGRSEFCEFNQDTENPEYVIVGDNRAKFDFEHLNRALRLLLGGAKLVGMIPELVDASMGEVELNVGSWTKMLENASGVKATFIGKPSPYMFELAFKTMNLGKNEVIMVGDKIAVDVKGARDFGIKSALLKTGEFNEKDLSGDTKPDFVFDSIRDVSKIF